MNSILEASFIILHYSIQHFFLLYLHSVTINCTRHIPRHLQLSSGRAVSLGTKLKWRSVSKQTQRNTVPAQSVEEYHHTLFLRHSMTTSQANYRRRLFRSRYRFFSSLLPPRTDFLKSQTESFLKLTGLRAYLR